MSEFTGPLAVEFLDDGRRARLLQPLRYEVDDKGSGKWVVIPAGFVSDGATVPRPLWWFLPPWGSRASKGPILHDYALESLAAGAPLEFIASRAEADRQLRIALIALGVPRASALAVWSGVSTWSRYRGLTGG